MARKRASDGDSSNPNKVLVVFLVLFILTTLGLGFWVYSIFGERRKYSDERAEAAAKEKVAKELETVWKFQALEARAMLGDDKSPEHGEWSQLREAFLADDARFKDMPGKDLFKKWITTVQGELGWNGAGKTYAKDYRKARDEWKRDADKYRSDGFAQLVQRKAEEEKNRSMAATQAADRKQDMAEIRKKMAEGLQLTLGDREKMEKEIELNKQYREDYQNILAEKEKEKRVFEAKIKNLEAQVAVLGGTGTKDPGKKGSAVGEVQAHALLLDISKGRPLWDRPRGKIIRIDERERRVYLDKGAEDGVTVGLSFNVFSAGPENRAEGPFKGTVEVMRVEPRTSVARITSLYDVQGNEISLNDPSPNKLLREGGNALKEGDLLFNLAWGAHVAIAGVVDWNGHGVQAAAAQMEDLEEFARVLRSQGIIVDAFVDLRDGQVRGAFTSRTAYLVRGYNVPGGGKGEEADRAKAVNDAIDTLKRAAVDRGLFLISPDNLVNVIGFRRPRSRTDMELTGFRPAQPTGGPVLAGVVAGAEGGKGSDTMIADVAGKWGGKLVGGGILRLSFKSDGGCVWQLVTGADKLTGYAPLVRSGQDYTVTIQGRPATVRLVNAGQGLQVSGQGLDAALTRE